MQTITLSSDTDFAGWRDAARALVLDGVKPADVTWMVTDSAPDLFGDDGVTPQSRAKSSVTFNVPARFVDFAKSAILHRDVERFAILYRLLCRIHADPDLMQVATDRDVALVQDMSKAVHRDQHKMKAFVRFREIGREPKNRFVAWFEPAHHIVEATSPFFARRFADMEWTIMTPDVCAHWDGARVRITPGVDRTSAPSEDRLEETWLSYYASIFNPARLKIKAMQAEMPKKYWRNLPEAKLIAPLIAKSGQSVTAMIADAATDAKPAPQRREPPMTKAHRSPTGSIEALRDEAADCRACPLWEDATQTVFGEGPKTARLMMVGEQPGDKEDLAGQPFVGPAGQILDRALKEAGIDRRLVYVTNAVKHFKFVPRGKIRLHQKPNTSELKACRPWYQRERDAIKPDLVVALGATAAHSVLGKATPVNANRGRLIELDEGGRALITVHPSYLLRLPDKEAKVREYARFVDDLIIAAGVLNDAKAA
ncbi:MAG: phage polymerase-related protein [Tardiphaga sp.]|nr:phage polymerase-related protein [Tardiphaga sp.]MDB5625541.1 phage polymerase-related protein [Tardiphaga sp.]